MSEWISCADEMPDNTRPEVLFYVKFLDQIELGKYKEDDDEWMVAFRKQRFHSGDVTHWMPLPKSPA